VVVLAAAGPALRLLRKTINTLSAPPRVMSTEDDCGATFEDAPPPRSRRATPPRPFESEGPDDALVKDALETTRP